MSAIEKVYPRGRTAGNYPSLSTRPDEAYIEFVQDARNALLHAQQAPIGAYCREMLVDSDMSLATDVESTEKAVEKLMADPVLKTYYRVKRSLQEAFWNRLVSSFGSRREELLAALDESEDTGPGSMRLNPDLPIPEYMNNDIHLQPGNNVNEKLAGFYYDYGLKIFMGGSADNDMLFHFVVKGMQKPEDGKVERILDLGVSAGAPTTALCKAFPDAEVWGIDISPSMVRYAHMRAAAQDLDVNFVQMNAEELDFPDENFDMVLAMLLYHELPVPAIKKSIAEAFRVLRPGGVFTVLDFPGDKSRDVYSMFFSEMDARDNGEPFLVDYVRSNVEDLLVEAGFELKSYEPAAALRTGRIAVKPLSSK